MTKDEFIIECGKIGINISKIKLEKLNLYKELLIEWNKKFNLTAIIEDKEIYLKHFYDSLCLTKAIDLNKKIKMCDFGTGAGFPGMVIAIIYSDLNVDLIESNNKKVIFLNEVKEKLELKNANVISERMENYSKKKREMYDIVTCRAVSNLGIISELSVGALKLNGYFLPLKSYIIDEVKKYDNAITNLGYRVEKIIEYELPFEKSIRNIPIIKKIKKTDIKIPREYNIIKKAYK